MLYILNIYIVTRGNSDHEVIRTIGHIVYYCVGWSEFPKQLDELKKLLRVFISFHFLASQYTRQNESKQFVTMAFDSTEEPNTRSVKGLKVLKRWY